MRLEDSEFAAISEIAIADAVLAFAGILYIANVKAVSALEADIFETAIADVNCGFGIFGHF